MPRKSVVILFMLLPPTIWAQHLSIGVTGGLALTNAFINHSAPDTPDTYSAAKDDLAGPAIELRLPLRLAVEFDALYRPLHLTESFFSILTKTTRTSQGTIDTWEFPLLAKYRLPGRGIAPFVEVGPSFRRTATSALFLGNPPQSNHGFTAGGGGGNPYLEAPDRARIPLHTMGRRYVFSLPEFGPGRVACGTVVLKSGGTDY